MNEQMTLMDLFGTQNFEETSTQLDVVTASFLGNQRCSWRDLFEGYNELYAITFSSGLQFVDKVLDQFDYAEIIYGCEGVMNDDVTAIMAMQMECVNQLVKKKAARHMAEKIESGILKLFVSRDTRSHEKIFVLRANDGRTRVITGSANMSASAFCGLQRENIVCFEDIDAYDHYRQLFEAFREQCTDQLTHKAIVGTIADKDYLQDNLDEIPIIKTVEEKKMILLEETHSDEEDDVAEIVVSIKGHEKEMKPMLPKKKNDGGKLLVTTELIKGFKRKHREHREIQKAKEKKLPKLHINYETGNIDFTRTDLP